MLVKIYRYISRCSSEGYGQALQPSNQGWRGQFATARADEIVVNPFFPNLLLDRPPGAQSAHAVRLAPNLPKKRMRVGFGCVALCKPTYVANRRGVQ